MTIVGNFNRILLVTFHRANDLKDADFVGKSDPYVKVHDFNDATAHYPECIKTSVVEDNCSPVWEETAFFLIGDNAKTFKVQIFDSDTIHDKVIGTVMLNVDDHLKQKAIPVDPKGTITISCIALPVAAAAGLANVVVPAGFAPKIIGGADRLVHISVRDAKVRNAEFLGVSDPYVKIENVEKKDLLIAPLRGKTISNSLTPQFNEVFVSLATPKLTSVRVHLFHDALVDSSLGHVDIPADRFNKGSFPLSRDGFVNLESRIIPFDVILAAATGIHPFVYVKVPEITLGRGWATEVMAMSVAFAAKLKLVISHDYHEIGSFEKPVVGGTLSHQTIEFTPSKVIDNGQEIEFDAYLFDETGHVVAKYSTFKKVGPSPTPLFRSAEEEKAIAARKHH